MSKHSVITGTGRSGTSFIVELLTRLGVDTGFDASNIQKHKYADAEAGMEINLLNLVNPPYLVKDPSFTEYFSKVIEREDLLLEHVFVVLRDLKAAAGSRKHVEERTDKSLYKAGGLPGGFSGAENVEEQEQVLLTRIFELSLQLASTDCQVTLLSYPLLVENPEYLYEKLTPLLNGIGKSKFLEIFHIIVDKKKVHKLSGNDSAPIYRKYSDKKAEETMQCDVEVMAQVFFDYGSGYSEKNSYFQAQLINSKEFVIDLPEGKKIKQLRFDPANEPCAIRLADVIAEVSSGDFSLLSDVSNTGYEDELVIYFTDNDPKINISLNSLKENVKRIRILFEYIEVGRNVRGLALPVVEKHYRKNLAKIRRWAQLTALYDCYLDKLKFKFKNWFLK